MTTRDRTLGATAVSLGVFLVYLATLSPAVAMWDAGEYIAAAKTIGIPHQPGNPLFILIAHLAGMLPLSESYDVRINLLAAASSALAAGFWFLCAERMLVHLVPGVRARALAAVGCALLGGLSFTVWNQSVVMEKVYPLSLLAMSVTAWLVMLWLEQPDGRTADRRLVLIGYLVGLGYAIHPAGMLLAPSIGLAALVRRPKLFLRWKFVALVPLAFLLGSSLFAVLPIRAAYQPYVNESAVSACESGALEARCTFSAETARRLRGAINREQYGGNAVIERRGPFSAQVQMFWQYFKWQWLRDVDAGWPRTQSGVAAAMLVLGLFGLASIRAPKNGDPARRTPHPAPYFWFFAPLTASFTIALIYYLNFRYGWTQSLELGMSVPREPRDRDYFYMWTFSLWGLLAGVGMVSFLRRRAALVAAIALLALAANWKAASRSGQLFTRDWAADMLNSVEPNGIIITNGDNDSFPLWHAQAVQGLRPDITITLVPYLGMDWYARQLNKRSPMWKLSDQELDSIPYVLQSIQPLSFRHGEIAATIPPGYITRDQLLVLRAIKDSFPARPVYFAMGPYAQQLGLGAYVKQVGLVQKLEATPIREDARTVKTGAGFVDIEKSLALWKSYRGPKQVVREGRWIDSGSANVPQYYVWVAQELVQGLVARGDTASAAEVRDLALAVYRVTQ